MGVGVVADLVAVRRHAADQVLVALHLPADDKEGGHHPPLRQAVQQGPGGVVPGPVVKSQGHVLGLFRLHLGLADGLHRLRLPDLAAAGGSQRQSQRQQAAVYPLHLASSFPCCAS